MVSSVQATIFGSSFLACLTSIRKHIYDARSNTMLLFMSIHASSFSKSRILVTKRANRLYTRVESYNLKDKRHSRSIP